MQNNPNKIDNFYEMFNSSRCKTALLIISCMIFTAIMITEMIGQTSPFLQYLAISVLGFWTGRATKPGNVNE